MSWSRENHGPRRSKSSSRRGSRGSDVRLWMDPPTQVVWSGYQGRGKHFRGQRVQRRVHPSAPERHDPPTCAICLPAVDGDGGGTPRKLGLQNLDFAPKDGTIDLRQSQRTAGEVGTWERCRFAEDGEATRQHKEQLPSPGEGNSVTCHGHCLPRSGLISWTLDTSLAKTLEHTASHKLLC